jgi:hypothetical protein
MKTSSMKFSDDTKCKPPPAPSGDEDDAIASYQDWKNCGWIVMRGQKAHSFDLTGIAQFSRHQVTKLK